MRTWQLRSLRTICFRNFSRHAYASPIKTPLAPSPASLNSFNHSIIFESLLLELSRVNPHTPIAPDAAAGTHSRRWDSGTRHDGSALTSLRGAVWTRRRLDQPLRPHRLQSKVIRGPVEYPLSPGYAVGQLRTCCKTGTKFFSACLTVAPTNCIELETNF